MGTGQLLWGGGGGGGVCVCVTITDYYLSIPKLQRLGMDK